MVSTPWFFGLVGAVALQRLAELSWSRRNERRMIARGGREHAPEQMRWMTALHTGWLIAVPLEVVLLNRSTSTLVSALALVTFLVGQLLRYAALTSLKERWCVRIVTVPGERVKTGGVYSWIRHPNYLGVCLEIAALPLVHGAWFTALVFSALNGLLLKSRIAAEEAALNADENYTEAFGRSAA